ncbi:unnamed protein product [Effrenium voratum]|nr:unnamed protein product [Effrenium voratum]
MASAACKPTQVDEVRYNQAIRRSPWREALDLLAHLDQSRLRAGVVSCNSAISACGAWQRAVALLRRGPRNIISYNATMALCDWMCTLSWLSQSQQDTLQPSNISVNTAVNAAGKAGRWQHALFALQELATPTVRSLGCAVTACETVRCWTWALQLLTGAPAAPNSVVFGAGISACRGQLVRAMQLLSEAERSLAQLDVIVFNAAISACETAGAWQEEGSAMVAEGNHLRLDLSDEDEKEFCSDEDTAPGSACCDSTTSCDSEEIVRAAPWKSGETTVLPLAAISSQGFAERAELLRLCTEMDKGVGEASPASEVSPSPFGEDPAVLWQSQHLQLIYKPPAWARQPRN